MPLHTENGQKTMGESLRHLICAVLNIAYPFSGNVNALMVCAVYRKGFAVQLIQQGTRVCGGGMKLIRPVVLVLPEGGQILADVPAEKDIDQLHALADAKNRFLVENEFPQNGELQPVKSRINDPRAAVQLAEEPGVNIAAARKNKPVVEAYVRHMQGDSGTCAQSSKGGFVVGGLFRITGNENFFQYIIPEKKVIIHNICYNRNHDASKRQQRRNLVMRIGMGYDVHRLTPGRKLIMGGVEIPWEKGLLGHSDADVLLHAIMDALLGAAALGDIGKHFPDTDPAYKGISSLELLAHVGKLLEENCFFIENIDATIIAQAPKMRPHIDRMRENIARTLGIEAGQVNLKATTEEGLGFTGTGEGISAQAICLLASPVGVASEDVMRTQGGCEGCQGCKRQ